jgi:hypothetical protein
MTLTSTPIVLDTFTNESHKTKSSDDIDEDEMTILESRSRAIERDRLE